MIKVDHLTWIITCGFVGLKLSNMADKVEHLKDINDWIKEVAFEHRDHLHVERVIIDQLRDKLATCMEIIDDLLNEKE
jgi:hypothetical protein